MAHKAGDSWKIYMVARDGMIGRSIYGSITWDGRKKDSTGVKTWQHNKQTWQHDKQT
jgi:hypothetical protein